MAPGKTAGGLFDMKSVNGAQQSTPQGPISTQGINRQTPLSAKQAGSPSSGTAAHTPTGSASPSKKVKSYAQVADTDWLLITTADDAKHYFNRKTKEATTKLPESVVEYVRRAQANAKQLAADKASSASASSKASSKPSSPTTSQSTAPPAQSTPIPQPQVSTTSSADATLAAASRSGDVEEAEHFEPLVKERKAPAEYYVRALDSLAAETQKRKTASAQDPSAQSDSIAVMPKIEFTAEEKASRREALQREYEEQTGQTDPVEFSEEDLEDLMQEEFESYAEEEDAGLDIPDYYSPITKRMRDAKKKKKSGDAEKATSPALKTLAELSATNLAMYEQGERMISRGETKKLAAAVKRSIERPQAMIDQGVPLNAREQSVYLNGQLILARCYNKLRQWNEASTALQRAREIDADHPYTMIISALNQIPHNEQAAAMTTLNMVLEKDHENLIAMRLLAECYLDMDDLITAEQVADDALFINKRSYENMILKAGILGIQGDMQASGMLIERAIKTDPSRPEAYILEAKLLLTVDDIDKAMEAIQQSHDCDSSYAPSYALLGKIFLDRQMFSDARNSFKAALTSDPYMVESLIGLATIEFEEGNYTSVLDNATLAVQVDNGAIDAWLFKGRAEIELRHYTAAIASFERAIILDPDIEESYLFLGTALHGAGRTKECIARMDQLLARHPDSAKARINKAFALQTTGQAEQALQLFEEAIEKDPLDEEAKMGKVSSLFSLGRQDEANRFFTTFKRSDNAGAFENAQEMARRTQAAHQKRVQEAEKAASSSAGPAGEMPASEAFRQEEFGEERHDEMTDEELDMEIARATEAAEVKWAPDAQEMGKFTPEQFAEALGQSDASIPDNLSPEQMMSEFQGEIARVNEMLANMGMPPVSTDPAENDATDAKLEETPMSEESMESYAKLVQEYFEKTQKDTPAMPDNEEDWAAAKSLGITPGSFGDMKNFDEGYLKAKAYMEAENNQIKTGKLSKKQIEQVLDESLEKELQSAFKSASSKKLKEEIRKKVNKSDKSL